jgi:hypothetical protein
MNLLKYIKDIWMPISLIIVSLIFWCQSYSLPPARYDPLGSSFFPRLLLTLIIGLNVVDLFIQLLSKKSNDSSKINYWETYKYIIYFLILIFLYLTIIYLGIINFAIVTFIFLLIFMWMLSPKKLNFLPMILLINVGILLIIYLVFVKYLWVSFD